MSLFSPPTLPKKLHPCPEVSHLYMNLLHLLHEYAPYTGHIRAGASPRNFDWGGGVGFIGTQTHLPPKFSCSSDFGHFILKMLENAKKYVLRKKDTEISILLGGGGRLVDPAVFKSVVVVTPTSTTPCIRAEWQYLLGVSFAEDG